METSSPRRTLRATGAALALAVAMAWAPAASGDEAPRREVHVERAFVEAGAWIGLGLAYYWLDPLANSADWDNPPVADRVNGRALRFDTNLNTTNFLLHPGAGALIYGFARDDGLSVPAALGIAAASSFVWEVGLEWREKPSLNDFVFSTLGGASFGEFGVHLGEYVNSSANRTIAREIAADVLGFARRFHGALDRDPVPEVAAPPDDLGFSSAIAHDFRVRYELAAVGNDAGDRGTIHRLAIDAAIVDMPGFLREGHFARGFTRGELSELRLRLGMGATGLDEVDLQTQATLVGHYAQDFDVAEDGALRGHASAIGAGMGYRFNALRPLGRHDQLSTVHLFGPHAQVWVKDSGVRAHVSVEASPEFGAIDSIAWPAFTAAYRAEDTKAVLQKQGYTYDYGVWARLRASLGWGPLDLDGAAAYGHYESIERLDRYQELVTNDAHASETVVELEADARAHYGIASLAVGAARRERTSVLGPILARRADEEVRASLGVVF